MFSKETIAEITAVARSGGHEPASLLAVAHVESGGIAYASVEGRREPLIRFEGHYFDARLSGAKRETARTLGLANPKAGKIANPQTQAGRWRLLDRAEQIDRRAARESTSWGLGQVMGAHWKMLGFSSVDELVTEARAGAAGQARLMAGYIEATGIDGALARRDWKAFARAYNGPGYARNAYDAKLASAWQRFNASVGTNARVDILRYGSTGADVSVVQRALGLRGHALVADGIFGRATQRAVKDFQKHNGLTIDGVVGPATRRALETQVGKTPISTAKPGIATALRDLIRRARNAAVD